MRDIFGNETKKFEEKQEEISFHSKIVGVTHDDRQEKIAFLKSGDVLSLRREPENQFDENAIAVFHGEDHLGYLNRKLAEKLSKQIDNGTKFSCEVSERTGNETGFLGCNIKIRKF